jgi:hypothetical protein
MLEVIEKRLVGKVGTRSQRRGQRGRVYASRIYSPRRRREASLGGRLCSSEQPLRPHQYQERHARGLSASLLPCDRIITMDLRAGYNYFRLHKDMRRYFVVSIALPRGSARYFLYIVLPFGWSRSTYWFCRQVKSCSQCGYVSCLPRVYSSSTIVCIRLSH